MLQEQLRQDPWRLLVACVMLNQTTAKQVNQVIWKFFERWPSPVQFMLYGNNPESDELTEMLRPMGFYNRRANTLRRMTNDYVALECTLKREPMRVQELYGVGKYAADSYMMFVVGYVATAAEDKELLNYVRWATERDQDRGGRDATA